MHQVRELYLNLVNFSRSWNFIFGLPLRLQKHFLVAKGNVDSNHIWFFKLIFVAMSLALLSKELSWVVSEDWFLDTEMPGKQEECFGKFAEHSFSC